MQEFLRGIRGVCRENSGPVAADEHWDDGINRWRDARRRGGRILVIVLLIADAILGGALVTGVHLVRLPSLTSYLHLAT
jgi:hypothetical protein